jgi:hypothetical protein
VRSCQPLGKAFPDGRQAIKRLVTRGPECVTTHVLRCLDNFQDSVIRRDAFKGDASSILASTFSPLERGLLTRHAIPRWQVSSYRKTGLYRASLLARQQITSAYRNIGSRCGVLPTSEEMTETSSSSFPFSSTAIPLLLLLNACLWSFHR